MYLVQPRKGLHRIYANADFLRTRFLLADASGHHSGLRCAQRGGAATVLLKSKLISRIEKWSTRLQWIEGSDRLRQEKFLEEHRGFPAISH